ncbi:MAG: hypothetical protein ACR2IF_08485 [Terriglobales bacterium]
MGPERRMTAARAFWDSAEQKDSHKQIEAALAQRLHARPQFIRKLSPEKKSSYLAGDTPNPLLWQALMFSYHFAAHGPMLADFLNTLGIPNDHGRYDAENIPPPTADALEKAVGDLRAKYQPMDVLVYLAALVTSDEQFWGGLAPVVDRMEKEIAAE